MLLHYLMGISLLFITHFLLLGSRGGVLCSPFALLSCLLLCQKPCFYFSPIRGTELTETVWNHQLSVNLSVTNSSKFLLCHLPATWFNTQLLLLLLLFSVRGGFGCTAVFLNSVACNSLLATRAIWDKTLLCNHNKLHATSILGSSRARIKADKKFTTLTWSLKHTEEIFFMCGWGISESIQGTVLRAESGPRSAVPNVRLTEIGNVSH